MINPKFVVKEILMTVLGNSEICISKTQCYDEESTKKILYEKSENV